MTYCVGLRLRAGLVFMSDTRTNAGVDNISIVRKMRTWSVPGERLITLMNAGNLATTQAVVSLLDERSKAPEERSPSILQAPTMFQVARLIGDTLKEVIAQQTSTGPTADAAAFSATIIVGGQIAGGTPCLFLVYPEGNFIEATDDTPFLQIGEAKYGKPILVRAFDHDMSLEDAAKLLLVSFDSTIKANLSVGMPLDLQFYEAGSLKQGYERRFEEDDAYYQTVSKGWGDAIKIAFNTLPALER